MSDRNDSSAQPALPRQTDADLRRRLDTWLDEALKQTFPASDPIATPPTGAPSLPLPDDEIDELSDPPA